MEISFQSAETEGGGAACKGKSRKLKGRSRGKNSNKFVGIRQRPSGRWVAEIKDTRKKKIRMWLGTFETAEEAARAYDEAACLLRGSNTRTNFIPQISTTNSPIASRIRTLLNNNKTPTPKPKPQLQLQLQLQNPIPADPTMFDGAYKPDMSNCLLEETEMGCWDSSSGYGFSMAEEVMKLPASFLENSEDLELSPFERMKVERQISASLYAMNGVHEYMEAVHEASQPIWDLPPLSSFFSSLED